MIKIIESKCKSKAAKSTTKPCSHAPRLHIGGFHNCKRLRTQEDLFGLQTGNSLGKNVVFLFYRKVWPLPQRIGLRTEIPMVQACGYPACGYPRVYCCTPATQAHPPEDWGQEEPEKLLLQVHSRILVREKTMEAQQIPAVARGPSVEGACRGCISVYGLQNLSSWLGVGFYKDVLKFEEQHWVESGCFVFLIVCGFFFVFCLFF